MQKNIFTYKFPNSVIKRQDDLWQSSNYILSNSGNHSWRKPSTCCSFIFIIIGSTWNIISTRRGLIMWKESHIGRLQQRAWVGLCLRPSASGRTDHIATVWLMQIRVQSIMKVTGIWKGALMRWWNIGWCERRWWQARCGTVWIAQITHIQEPQKFWWLGTTIDQYTWLGANKHQYISLNAALHSHTHQKNHI